jgi:hypothetical protein
MQPKYVAQAPVAFKIIQMLFKCLKVQIYLIIYLSHYKIKSKAPCCLHYFNDGI